jgi:hypothetical protein
LSIIFAGGSPIALAVSIASQIGIGYMNYRKNKNQYKLDKERQEWELQRSAMEQFNGLRRELFEAAWRLSDTYKFDDKYRLTEKQIKRYNEILVDPDPLRRYEKMDVISDSFSAFPPFWYYKGNAAMEVYRSPEYKNTDIGSSYKEKALSAYQKYDNIYEKFMREDVVAASCAIEHVSLLDPNKDKEDIKRLLQRADDVAGENFDVLQICVLGFISINEIDDAKKTLQKLVNENYNISLNGLLLSRIYCRFDKNKVDYDILCKRVGKENVMPWNDDDVAADKAYIDSKRQTVSWRFDTFLADITNKYNDEFIKKIGYDKYADPPDKISWFKYTNTTSAFVESLNQYFDEIRNIDIFRLQQRADGDSWNLYFKQQATIISKHIQDFYQQATILKNELKTFEVHTIRKYHDENCAMRDKIDKLISKYLFLDLTAQFRENIGSEFNNNFSVKTAESADEFITIFDEWYNKAKLPIPKQTNEKKGKAIVELPKINYFNYNEITGGEH